MFIDAPGAALGRGVVTAINIATHAVGTGQQGTITLARSFGTVENLSIGTWRGAYGSAGTFGARRVRGAFLYLSGSMGGGTVPAARVNVGTLPSPRLGTVGAGKVAYGTIGLPRHQRLSALFGTVSANQWAGSQPPAFNIATKATSGTLAVARLLQRMGTKLAGSLAPGNMRRYAVWPVPFANATYFPRVTYGFNTSAVNAMPAVYMVSRSAGSMQYGLTQPSPDTVRLGSVFLEGHP